jgi:tetratricopeptide (TPR) repeat protein
VLAIAVTLGCTTRTPSPRRPTPEVKAELERAEAAEAERRHDVARTHYERAISVAKPPASLGLARREYGETLATWGELDAARAQLEGSVTSLPSDPVAWQMLGIVRHKLGDLDGAVVALERSKQLAPRAWIPRRDLAALHWSRGEGRSADPDPAIAARHRAAALAEYRAMLELELPDRLREKVRWAIDVLSRPAGAPPPSS